MVRQKTRNTATRKLQLLIIAALLVATMTLAASPNAGSAQQELLSAPQPSVTAADDSGDNLLSNGGLNGDYYWKYPNHYTAPDWNRWWTDGSLLPEYDRTRGDRPYIEGDRAQRYHWRTAYEAGIYQVVDVTPCVRYELTAWARNHIIPTLLPHARVGLDPTGTQLTSGPGSGGVKNGLPPLTAWSVEQTKLWEWEALSTTAEAANDQVTAILYAAPEAVQDGTVPSYDTYWDDVSLIAVPFDDDRLPTPTNWSPSGFITQPTATYANGNLTIEWETLSAASTQVWYAMQPKSSPITSTTSYSYTTYFPIIASFSPPTAYMSELDTTPVMQHQVIITGLGDTGTVVFVALSRHADGSSCTTETSELIKVSLESGQLTTLDIATIDQLIPEPEQQR